MTEKILESPGWKTFFSVVIPLIVGVFSGTLVTELTTPTGLNWPSFYKTVSFYGLLIVTVISYVYFRAVYMYERQIDRFLDDDYCRAYMRSKCLPEAAERYKELIRSGQKGDLTSAMKEFEKLLK